MAVSQAASTWTLHLSDLPPDPIMTARQDFASDQRLNKINAGIGMIMNPATKKPFVPAMFKKVAKRIAYGDVGYLSSSGHEGYLASHAKELVFGPRLWGSFFNGEKVSKPKSMVWAQTIGGTSALSLTANLIKSTLAANCKKLLLDTGWPNHPKIFSGFKIINYIHENPETREYNHDKYISLLKKHNKGCPVLLQVCGYNDDGAERSKKEWLDILDIVKTRDLLPILDFAYNGLVRGWKRDNYPIKIFAKSGLLTIICVSNSKNIGYSVRLGSLYIANLDVKHAPTVQQTLDNKFIRPSYSNPNALPAQVMHAILSNPPYIERYKSEVDSVRTNILEKNRAILAAVLGLEYSWIKRRKGLFLKLVPNGFSKTQCNFLKEENAIHGPKSSRINMGGFNPRTMGKIALIYKQALRLD